MLIISQKDWITNDLNRLSDHLRIVRETLSRRNFNGSAEALVLLPHGSSEETIPAADELFEALGKAAENHGVYLAGSALVNQTDLGTHCTLGFVIGADGTLLLKTEKISPELVNGLATDQTSALGKAMDFQVATTPIGQVGVLPGEDILFAHYARSLVWKGAEAILNPSAEVQDHLFDARMNARKARAFENTAYIVSTSAVVRGGDGAESRYPSAAVVYDWEGRSSGKGSDADIVLPDMDIEKLRRKRDDIFSVQALHLRANLYADGYERRIKAEGRQPAAPKTRDGWVEEAQHRVQAALSQDPPKAGARTQYDVLLTQTVKTIIQKDADVEKIKRENLTRALEMPAIWASNPDIKLVVFGEFFMTGQGGHGYRSPLTLQRLAIRYPGPELEVLSDFALKHKTFVCGSTFEIDDKLPGHVFNSAFILNDSGDLIHRYRKIQCADVWGSLPDTTPSSIYDRYLDTYGYDFLFPVADTAIGKLATMVCFDQAHPEVARMLTKYGAEVIIHPTSEGHGSGRDGWDSARVTRAFENTAYLLSAMPGGEYFNANSKWEHSTRMRGGSRIVRFDGTVLGTIDRAGVAAITGTIDLLSLRQARANPHVNLALWDDPQVYIDNYREDVGLPNNLWGLDPLVNPYKGMVPLKKRLSDYYERGVFVPPMVRSGQSSTPPGRGVGEPEKEIKAAPKSEGKRLKDMDKMDGEFIPV